MRFSACHRLIVTLAVIVGSGPVSVAAQDAGDAPDHHDAAGATVRIDDLEWSLATNGKNIKWPDAVEYCEALELGGHDDWRLPLVNELKALFDPDAANGQGIRSPFVIGDCCLWSGESLVDRPAEDTDEIAGRPEMYHWGFMFDGGLVYYAVHLFEDGRALCARDAR